MEELNNESIHSAAEGGDTAKQAEAVAKGAGAELIAIDANGDILVNVSSNA